MKEKHIATWMKVCGEIGSLSNCPRLKFGAVLINPIYNTMIASGYNGGPKDGSDLCGDNCCLRNELQIPSGTQIQIGCVHAEMNLICNAAKQGSSTEQCWVLVDGEPCLLCAKLMHHAGIVKVIVLGGVYSTDEGVKYLEKHGVEVEYRNSY